MISALYGGVVAGLIATLLSAVTTAYLFMTPQFSMAIDHSDIFRLVVFAAVALLTSWIAFQRNRIDEQQQRLVDGASGGERAHQDAERHVADLSRLPARQSGGDAPEWKTVETYLADTPELQLSHALCPECSARHFPEFHAPTV